MLTRMTRILTAGSLALLSALAGVFGYRVLESDIASDIYRQRLADLGAEHDALIGQYNEAVRRSAVTELVVEGGELRIIVRTIDGTLSEIETPYDPSGEIYVDFAVVDGRLWVRRVFDANTPPSAGVVVDPKVARMNWDTPGAVFGKAVYRSLDEGRWVVTVTGNGSLGLERAPREAGELSPPPLISSPEEITDADARVKGIGAGDVWTWLVSGEK